jgi:hypothetical protein
MSLNTDTMSPVITGGMMYPALYNLIWQIAMPNMITRQMFQPYSMTSGNAVTFPKQSGSPGAVADEVSEGAEIPLDVTDYSQVVVVPKKVGQGIIISKETIEDAMLPIQQDQLVRKTLLVANKIDKDCIDVIAAGYSGSVTSSGKSLALDGTEFVLSGSGGPGIGTYDISEAVSLIENNNYIPDTLICHPRVKKYLQRLPNYTAAFAIGGAGTILSGMPAKAGGPFATLNGLECFATTNCPTGSAFVLCRGTSPNIMGQFSPMGFFVERRPLTTEVQAMPSRDSMGIFVTTRYGVSVVNGDPLAIISGINVT